MEGSVALKWALVARGILEHATVRPPLLPLAEGADKEDRRRDARGRPRPGPLRVAGRERRTSDRATSYRACAPTTWRDRQTRHDMLDARGLMPRYCRRWRRRPPAFPERDKTLRIVVPFAAGGGVDNAARLLGDAVAQAARRDRDRREQGRRQRHASAARRCRPRRPTATRCCSRRRRTCWPSRCWRSPPYDPQTDFAPVARVGEAPLMLVIAPQSRSRSWPTCSAAARSSPRSGLRPFRRPARRAIWRRCCWPSRAAQVHLRAVQGHAAGADGRGRRPRRTCCSTR